MSPSVELRRYATQYAPLWLVLAITLFVFGATYRAEFIIVDDPLHITENPALLEGNLKSFWTQPYRGLFIPITYTMWGLEKKASDLLIGPKGPSGVSPVIFHITNVVLHLANVALLFLILFQLVGGNKWAAAVGALLFAIHPLQVEAVAWISGRKDLLSGFFCLTATLAWLEFLKADAQSRKGYYALATLAFVAAMLSKPSSLFLPFFLFGISVLFLKRSWKSLVLPLSPWVLALVPYSLYLPGLQPWETKIAPPAVLLRPFIALDSVAFYIYKFLVPLKLGIDYTRTPDAVLSQNYVYWTPLIPVAIGALLHRYAPKVYFCLFLIVLVSFAPVSGLIPFAFQQFSTVADRYAYLPFFTVALIAALVYRRYGNQVGQVVTTFVLALWVGISCIQVGYWNSSALLFRETLSHSPRSVIANGNLGTILEGMGRNEEAEKYYAKALEINPNFPHHYYNLGNIWMKLGKVEQSVPLFEEALRRQPKLSVASYNLGRIYFEKKRFDESERYLKQTLQNTPSRFQSYTLMGLIKQARADADLGRAWFEKSLSYNPHFIPAHVELAKLAEARHDREQALFHYSRILAANPNHAAAKVGVARLQAPTR